MEEFCLSEISQSLRIISTDVFIVVACLQVSMSDPAEHSNQAVQALSYAPMIDGLDGGGGDSCGWCE